MYGYIYKTTNLINRKIYIGQKKSLIFLGNDYLGSVKYLKNAINKYGIENFEVQLIEKAETKQQLDELEKFYIKQFNSIDKNIGYNIANGAVGGDTYSGLSDEDKLIRNNKLKQSHKNRSPNYIKRVYIYKDDITKLINISELQEYLNLGWNRGRGIKFKQAMKDKNKNRICTEETRLKLKEAWINKTDEQMAVIRKKHSVATKLQMQNTPKEERIKRAKHAAEVKNNKNRVWVHKDEIHKFINKQELSNYINDGYILGFSELRKMNLSKSQQGKSKSKGFIYVYKNDICKRVDKTELVDYLNDGWQKGNLYLRGIERSERKK